MPIERGLPTRKSAPGKTAKPSSSSAPTSRRRTRGLPLAGGGALSSSSSSTSSSAAAAARPSSVASASLVAAPSSSSSSSKKKKKSPGQNTTASSAPVKSEPGVRGRSPHPPPLQPPQPPSSSAPQRFSKTAILQAKLDKANALRFCRGKKQGPTVWTVRVTVNGAAFDPSSSSSNRSAFAIRRNNSSNNNNSSNSNNSSSSNNNTGGGSKTGEAYRPRRHRAQSSQPKGTDGNFHYCKSCGEVGDVVCCDGCPHVYHPQCLPEESESFAALDTQHDDDPWFCPDCAEKKPRKKTKKKAGGGTEAISPYRQQRPRRKCSHDAAGDPEDDDYEGHGHGHHREGLVDEDGDPVAVAVAEDDAYSYGHDGEETEISEAVGSSSFSLQKTTTSSGTASKHRSSSPKSPSKHRASGSTPLSSSAANKKKSKHSSSNSSSSSSNNNSSNININSNINSNSNKRQKTSGRPTSPVRSRAASPTEKVDSPSSDSGAGPYDESDHNNPSGKKKDKKKKKKKKKKDPNSGTEDSLQPGASERDDGAASPGDRKNSTSNEDSNNNGGSGGSDEGGGGGMFSHLLNNNASGLVKAVPAFYFFLNENRNKIDRNLSRKHRYFNRLPKANMERNQLIAKEGIVLWSKLNDAEVKRYIDISMKDFEKRIIEWKEEKTLRSMFMDAETEEGDVSGDQPAPDSDRDLLLEDERLTHENHQRLYLATTVGYKPYKPDLEESNNRILLELLQDTRFHPLPMIMANRPAQEYGEMDFDRITIPYFDVNGPVSTCLGDECLGCARGWTHFCNVLKRRIPAVARRAKLQPPLSSLVATRIGLGLKNPQLTEDLDGEFENGGETKNGANSNGGIKKSSEELVETFTSRDIPSVAAAKALPHYPWEHLTAPTERADDVVRFVEEAVCMKIPEPPRPGYEGEGEGQGEEEDPNPAAGLDEAKIAKKKTPSPSKTIRLNLPLRKERRRQLDDFSTSTGPEDDDNEEITVNKCGRCRTIIEGDTGCVPCRRAQLVINMSRGEGQTEETEASKLLRIQTNMLGRVVMRDGEVEPQKEGDEAVSNYILRQRWTPFVILPPSTLISPKPRADRGSGASNEDEGDEGDDIDGNSEDPGEESASACDDATEGSDLMDVDSRDAPRAVSDDAVSDEPMEIEEDNSSAPISLHEDEADTARIAPPPSKRLRVSSRIVALESNGTTSGSSASKAVTDADDRNLLTKKFKEEANTLFRKCVSIACYGILLALKRRDPLLHFAEPVDAEGYNDIIQEPMDFGKIKKNVLRNKYATLGAFVSDARLLCNNAMLFNPPDSIYYKTAKELSDVLTVMQKRSSEWINTMKDAHAATFNNIFHTKLDHDGKVEQTNSPFLGGDPFHRLREEWPEAVEMYEDNEWLQKAVETDFMRTKENESAYFGSLAIRRAAMAAAVSLAPYTDSSGMYNVVGRRTYEEDEKLRKFVAEKVAEAVHPPELKELPSWREEMIMRVLRKSQARRMEGRMGSTHGCARCDGVRVDPESNKAINAVTVRWGRTRKKPNEVPRIHKSRLGLSTGLGSQNTQERIKRHKASDIRKGLRKGKTSALVAAADKVNEVAVTARGSRIHGMGLFADQALQKGDVVAEYVGEYVSPAVTDAREKEYQKERIQDYQFRIDSQLVIDATKRGGHGRYANHNCDPNCVTKIIPFKLGNDSEKDGETTGKTRGNGNILKRVVIVALRDIEPMEELTYDYQFPLEVDLNERIPCNCNSELCRGFMNWDLPEKGARNQVFRTQKRGANMRDRIRRLGRPLKGDK